MAQQISKGWTYGITGDAAQVTHTNLNSHVDNASLLIGAITDQSINSISNDTDKILIAKSDGISLNSQTKADFTKSLTTQTINGGAGVNLVITPASTYKVNVAGAFEADSINSIGATTIGGTLDVTGDINSQSTGAVKISVGTTAQRPSTPSTGQIRFNTTTTSTEVYNGATWEVVGGSPFDATGGNTVIAPDKVVTSATFTSTDGAKVVVTSTAHTVYVGTTVLFTTSVSGYSGTWTITETTSNTFTFWMDVVASPVSTATACTYNKNFKYKTHIFTSSGTFTPLNLGKYGEVEVLVVGGGGSGSYTNAARGYGNAGGGAGGYLYIKNYKINSLSPINVTIGNSNQDSLFGTLVAYKGQNASPDYAGASGGNNLGFTGYSGYYDSPIGHNYGSTINGAGALGAASTLGSFAGGNARDNYIVFNIIGYNKIYCEGGSALAEQSPNTGNGGYPNGALGCSGIVIVRYPYLPT
jgi:hypothetical protein